MGALIWVVRFALLPVLVTCPYLRSFQQIVNHQLAVCCLLVAELSLICDTVFIGNALLLHSFVDTCLSRQPVPPAPPSMLVGGGWRWLNHRGVLSSAQSRAVL
jgi:hypothetical protein